jgi:hypothetical protein
VNARSDANTEIVRQWQTAAQVRSALNVFLQRKVASRVKNTLFNAMPTLDFLFGLNGRRRTPTGSAGPTPAMLAIGRINTVSRARRETVAGPTRVPSGRAGLEAVQLRHEADGRLRHDARGCKLGHDQRARQAVQAAQIFKFARGMMPFVIPHTDLRTVKRGAGDNGAAAASAVGSVYDIEVKSREAAHCEQLNADLFATAAAGVPTDEDVLQWDRFHSLHAALKADNTYAGDRQEPAGQLVVEGQPPHHAVHRDF